MTKKHQLIYEYEEVELKQYVARLNKRTGKPWSVKEVYVTGYFNVRALIATEADETRRSGLVLQGGASRNHETNIQEV